MNIPVQTDWIPVSAAPDGAAHFDGFLALPPAGSGPGLLLLQEIFGVNNHIRAVAEQYALDGFVVLAPDLFWRSGPRIDLGYTPETIQQGIAMASSIPPDGLLADLQNSVATLRARPEVAGRKVGAIGYCLGGRLAYTAAALAGVDAAVAYYGGGIQGQLALAAGISCPTLFHYAENDANIPLAAVEQVRAAMAGKDAQFHIYPGAHHGFNCWARGAYDAPSAALAHGRSLEFLARQIF
jgi:carboxymethylenebutenolidase